MPRSSQRKRKKKKMFDDLQDTWTTTTTRKRPSTTGDTQTSYNTRKKKKRRDEEEQEEEEGKEEEGEGTVTSAKRKACSLQGTKERTLGVHEGERIINTSKGKKRKKKEKGPRKKRKRECPRVIKLEPADEEEEGEKEREKGTKEEKERTKKERKEKAFTRKEPTKEAGDVVQKRKKLQHDTTGEGRGDARTREAEGSDFLFMLDKLSNQQEKKEPKKKEEVTVEANPGSSTPLQLTPDPTQLVEALLLSPSSRSMAAGAEDTILDKDSQIPNASLMSPAFGCLMPVDYYHSLLSYLRGMANCVDSLR